MAYGKLDTSSLKKIITRSKNKVIEYKYSDSETLPLSYCDGRFTISGTTIRFLERK